MNRAHTVRWITVAVYAVAMAWLEAAVVFYLRTMVNRIEPYQPNPLPEFAGLNAAELAREAATLVMLASVGVLAGTGWRSRTGYAALAFGIWDIFYYVFLKVLTGWPHSLLDWDILFLIPLPWWGPVIAPISIAVLMIVWGTAASRAEPGERAHPLERRTWAAAFVGGIVALYVFMTDAIKIAGQGEEAIRNVLPLRFNWPLFAIGLLLMAVPVIAAALPPRSRAGGGDPAGGALSKVC